MAGDLLLDTNVVVAYFVAEPAVVAGLQQANHVYSASVVLGELYFGAFKSTRVDENLARIQRLLTEVTILDCDGDTAREYGRIKDALRQKGRPLPNNDIWIAALAVQHDLTLVSRDAHFLEVDGLAHESW